MKKLIFGLLLLPLMAASQTVKPASVVNAFRVFPKMGKSTAFAKALTAHVNKYHKNKWTWRVFAIETGPDAGGFHITEGPATWDEFDNRGDLGAAHTQDWEMNVAPLLQERNSSSYGVYREDLSSVPLTSYTNNIAITHLKINPGYFGEMQDLLKTTKPVYDATNRSVAVYESSSSGEPGFNIVTRYKDGLKERDPGYRESMKDAYEKKHGAGSWQRYQDGIKKAVQHSWSELLSYKANLSSQ